MRAFHTEYFTGPHLAVGIFSPGLKIEIQINLF